MGVRHTHMSRSQVIDNDLNPKWDEDFKLLVHEPEHQVFNSLCIQTHKIKEGSCGESHTLTSQPEFSPLLSFSLCWSSALVKSCTGHHHRLQQDTFASTQAVWQSAQDWQWMIKSEMCAQVLRCVLYDYDALDRDDIIGDAKISVRDLKNQEEEDIWLDIKELSPQHPGGYKVGPYHKGDAEAADLSQNPSLQPIQYFSCAWLE